MRTDAGADDGSGGSDRHKDLIMEARLVLHILAVVILVVASVVAMADQSGKLVGVHEIPPFVTQRVELTPGVAADRQPAGGAPAARPGTTG